MCKKNKKQERLDTHLQNPQQCVDSLSLRHVVLWRQRLKGVRPFIVVELRELLCDPRRSVGIAQVGNGGVTIGQLGASYRTQSGQ